MDRRTVLRQLGLSSFAALAFGDGEAVFARDSRARSGRLLIRGALVVNADGRREADVLVEEEKIAAIGPGLRPFAEGLRTFEAQGLQLLPGGIDPHVHLTSPYVDDFDTGSRAALAGGITSLGVMAFGNDGETLSAVLERYERMLGKQASADVMLHPFLGNPPVSTAVAEIAGAGHSSFKLISVESDFDQEFSRYVETLARAREIGSLPMIHCEDYWVLKEAQRQLAAADHTSIAYYEQSRPVLSEVLAVQKVVALCELTGCPVYIVHLSSARALRVCEDAQSRGLPVFVETRPIYLHLTAERYGTPDGPLYVGFPPLRRIEDCEALWQGLQSGSIQTVGSDHAPWLKRQKLDPQHDIRNPLAGMSNLQTMLPMLYSEGVAKGRLSLERFVAVTAGNPARLFGLYPRKGVIQVGADADLVLWDPAKRSTVHAADDLSRADFSIYEGWSVTGAPVMTVRRGAILFEKGAVHGAPGTGQLLRRRGGQHQHG